MSLAIHSNLDFSALHSLRARRYARAPENDVRDKLNRLRKLRDDHKIGAVARRLTERRIEQSFNEQLFAKVFGYRTLFSHDTLPYHLLPQAFSRDGGEGISYTDFSLGFFSGEETDRTIATAELKGPTIKLDHPCNGESAVEQAFRAAQGKTTCKWVIVCNFLQLRLYAIDEPDTWIVAVDLSEIANAHDLACLCAHFDREALLGSDHGEDGRLPDMDIARNTKHPDSQFDPTDGHYRIALRFTPGDPMSMPIYQLERELRETVQSGRNAQHLFSTAKVTPAMRLHDNWEVVEGNNLLQCKIAVSRAGDIRLYARDRLVSGPRMPGRRHTLSVNLQNILVLEQFFFDAAQRICRVFASKPQRPAFVDLELRDVEGKYLVVDAYHELGAPSDGCAEQSNIVARDFEWNTCDDPADVATRCTCEIAINFRTERGGVVIEFDKFRGAYRTVNSMA